MAGPGSRPAVSWPLRPGCREPLPIARAPLAHMAGLIEMQVLPQALPTEQPVQTLERSKYCRPLSVVFILTDETLLPELF
jgi:hypothetical protein